MDDDAYYVLEIKYVKEKIMFVKVCILNKDPD